MAGTKTKKPIAKKQTAKPLDKTKKASSPKAAKAAPKKKPAVAKPAPKAKAVSKPAPRVLPRAVSIPSFGNPAAAVLSARAQSAIDRIEIADVLYCVARGLDRLDETLLRSAFHADASLDLGPGVFQGTSADYILWTLGVMGAAKETQHFVANVHAQIEGDVALVESYVQTHMRMDKPTGREDLFIGSRMLDRFEKRPSGPTGVWKIAHRKEILDWVRTEPVSDIFYHQNPDALWSMRTKTDPSYQMAQFPGSQSGTKLPSFLGRRYETKSVKI